MDKEWRVVSLNKRGYFALTHSHQSASGRVREASRLGSKDPIGISKVQSRELGIEGDDSTWRDEDCLPELASFGI